jgi:hypothetical protein
MDFSFPINIPLDFQRSAVLSLGYKKVNGFVITSLKVSNWGVKRAALKGD